MLNSGGVVIHMHQSLDKISYLVPQNPEFDAIAQQPSMQPFSEEIISLLSQVSHEILKDKVAKSYPDVITFAFWCRKASLINMKEQYTGIDDRIGKGVIFHITPSNVPVNFAYSLAAGLLAGNINIVRVPTKEYPQIDIITRAIVKVLKDEKFKHLRRYITLLRYNRDDKINTYFSELSDIRVIWGGDSAIKEIRTSPLKVRAFDVTFSDRYSICIINAKEYLDLLDTDKVTEGFYNDTFLFDQNACTAPHLIVWLGSHEQVLNAKKRFWEEIHSFAQKKYDLQPIQAIDKLTRAYKAATELDVKWQQSPDNLITRGDIIHLKDGVENYHCNSGFFLEYTAKSLDEIKYIINNKYQTLSYLGLDSKEIVEFVIKNQLRGIDRIVPIGKTTDFSLTWDGYDLIRTFSRKIYSL